MAKVTRIGGMFLGWGGSVKMLVLLVAIFGVFAASAIAQTSASDDLWLSRMVGHWVLEGRIAGQETIHDVDGEWVLNRLYVRLHEVSREKDARGQPVYEAIIYVTRDATQGEYAVLWLDNTASGAFAAEGTGHAKPKGESLPFVFKDSQGTISFINTFAYDPTGRTWSWSMDNVEKGVPKPFGRVKLRAR